MEDDTSTSLDWRQVKCNPLVFQGFRPPFTVPPEQVSTWTDKDERDYKIWLGIGSKDTRDDYRQFLLSLNMEYDMDEVFNRMDVGLEAFEKLVACMREFPKYNLSKDLDKMYPKDSAVFKDFIKCGVDIRCLMYIEEQRLYPYYSNHVLLTVTKIQNSDLVAKRGTKNND